MEERRAEAEKRTKERIWKQEEMLATALNTMNTVITENQHYLLLSLPKIQLELVKEMLKNRCRSLRIWTWILPICANLIRAANFSYSLAPSRSVVSSFKIRTPRE